MGIKTNSQAPGEPKDPADSHLFSIYQAFASPAETEAMRTAFRDGISWGDAKQRLFERIDQDLAPARQRYQHYIDHPQEVEMLLLRGAERARAESKPFIAQLREAVGLRSLAQAASKAGAENVATTSLSPELKQYREADGQFYFKLAEKSRGVLVQSIAFANGRDAGAVITAIRRGDVAIVDDSLQVEGATVARLVDGADRSLVEVLLAMLFAQAQDAESKKFAQ